MAAGYADWMRAEFGDLIDALDLDEMQKRFLRSRWLDQVIWLEGKAAQTQPTQWPAQGNWTRSRRSGYRRGPMGDGGTNGSLIG